MRKKLTSVRGFVPIARGAPAPQKARGLDLMARHAARAMDASTALVVVAGPAGPRLAASCGIDPIERLEDSALFEASLRQPGALLVGDLSKDERFRADPLVTGAPRARFFAGRRLCLDDATPVGALVVLDARARDVDEATIAMLDEVANLLEGFFERTRHGLSPGEVASAFPFAFVLDRNLRIVHAGRSLSKVCNGSVLGTSFDHTFLLRRPSIERSFDALASARGATFVVENVQTRAVLRGSMSTIGGGDTLMFLGSPRLTSAKDLARLGLGVDDFALHDQAMDMLQLLEDRAKSIGDLQQMNIELTRAKATAEDATRATSTFLAHMSHELRTPMNAVLGMATLILDTDLSAAQKDYVETIRSSGASLLTVVNDVLDFSKIESGMMAVEEVAFSPIRLIDEALEIVALPGARKGIELAGWCAPEVPAWLVGDPSRIRQILLNLLSNAVKFTLEGHAALTARYEVEGSVLEVIVEDTGIGMSWDVQQAIFDPFTQAESSTTRRFGGTGLGLTISRRLAEIMGGTLEVTSVPERGSRFILRVPCVEAIEPEASAVPSIPGAWRAVVVDASPLHLRALQQRLDHLGAEVTTATSFDEAADLVRRGSVQLVVIGVRDPDEARVVGQRLQAMRGTPSILCVPPGGRVDDLGVRVIQRPAALMHLARAVTELLSASSPERFPSAAPAPRLSVLLVEDDLVNQRVASLLLARIGLRCEIASNGLEAIERVTAQRYDVILMDMQMPELDGVEATRRIRALPIEQPVIVALTASTSASERMACFDAGVDGFLPKPIDPELLQAAMMKVAHRQPIAPKPSLLPPAPGRSGQTLSLKNRTIRRDR